MLYWYLFFSFQKNPQPQDTEIGKKRFYIFRVTYRFPLSFMLISTVIFIKSLNQVQSAMQFLAYHSFSSVKIARKLTIDNVA